MPKLPVKFKKQSERMYCYVASIKMLVDYAIDELQIDQKRLRIRTIAKALRTHPNGGTAPGDIERINSELADSFPHIQVKDQIGGGFNDIREEIDEPKRRPLIAWIVIARDDGDPIFHAVLINGYSRDRTKIYYVDPEMTQENHQCEAEVGDFINNKLTVEGHLIKLVITERGEKDLMGGLHPIRKRRQRS